MRNHWIYLDHDQTLSGSFGASYLFKEARGDSTRVYLDAIYGSGLRQSGGGTENGLPGGDPIPNGSTVLLITRSIPAWNRLTRSAAGNS